MGARYGDDHCEGGRPADIAVQEIPACYCFEGLRSIRCTSMAIWSIIEKWRQFRISTNAADGFVQGHYLPWFMQSYCEQMMQPSHYSWKRSNACFLFRPSSPFRTEVNPDPRFPIDCAFFSSPYYYNFEVGVLSIRSGKSFGCDLPSRISGIVSTGNSD